MISLKNTETQYGLIARLLHWTSVALLISLVVISSEFEGFSDGEERAELVTQHSSMGLLFLIVMLTRLSWRIKNINPIKSYAIRNWQKLLAIALHRSIYVVMFTQCALGIYLLCLSGSEISFFGLVELPALMSKSEGLFDSTLNVHDVFANLIYLLLSVHISAAIYHQIFGVIDHE